MLASNMTGLGANAIPAALPEVIEVRETIPNQDKKIEVKKNVTVEEYVKNYFSDIPIMIEIAKCESRFRQHDQDGQAERCGLGHRQRVRPSQYSFWWAIHRCPHLEDHGK
jgi:hypothetical protein